jgi:hypothetical protein
MKGTKSCGTAAKVGENGENKPRPVIMEVPCLLEGNLAMVACRGGPRREPRKPPWVRPSQPPSSEKTESDRRKDEVASATR